APGRPDAATCSYTSSTRKPAWDRSSPACCSMPWRAEKIGDARRAFERQQRALDQQPAAEAGERAVGADDAVAGNDDRQRVRAVRETHGACPADVAEAARQFAIGDGLTIRDGLERLPDRQLERGAFGGQRQSEGAAPPGKVL